MARNYSVFTLRLLVVLLFSTLHLNAQDKEVEEEDAKDSDRLVEKANERYEKYAFSPAIDVYQKVLERGFVSADLLKKLGNAYYFNANYEKAHGMYSRLIEEFPEETEAPYYFRCAQTCKTLGDYDRAEQMMLLYSRKAQLKGKLELSKEEYMAQIEKNSGRYTLGVFPYNSSYSDFAPTYYKEGLLFSSDRDTGNLARYRHSWNNQDFLDLYLLDSIKDLTGEEERVPKLSGPINTRLHESTTALGQDGQVLYFTRNNLKDGRKGKDSLGIIRLKMYRAIWENEGWNQIEELPINSDEFSTAHPTLSPNGKTMIFASDRPGGYGESDLYKVEIREDGSFGQPENLGAGVNTPGRETFPFISKDSVLYFASDGHYGLGGLDLFATRYDELMNQSVVNLGRPINSPKDDFSLIFDPVSQSGFFASNRGDDPANDDIVPFDQQIPLDLNCYAFGLVRDRNTQRLLVGATIEVIDENNQVIRRTKTDARGVYRIRLLCGRGNFVRASMPDYQSAETFLAEPVMGDNNLNFDLEPEIIVVEENNSEPADIGKLLALNTIYFDLNKFAIRSDAEVELQKIVAVMDRFPSLKIRVVSHTDSRGNDDYNLWLSQKRADATIEYISQQGIAIDRLIAEGKGETEIINQCKNDVPCSRANHQLNRRSEFLIFE